MTCPRPPVAAVAVVLSVPPAGTAAQEPVSCESPVDVPGRVASVVDGTPVAGASVVVPSAQLRTVTDPLGGFLAPGICPGLREISVSHPGYGTRTVEASVAARRLVEIRLRPRAVPLEGLVVEVEPVLRQLERRRMAHGWKSDAFHFGGIPPEELPASIPEYVAARSGHPLYSCGDAIAGDVGCYPYRGETSEVWVCLDEGRFPGGVPMLETFPPDHIARVEFYPDSGLMKVYTKRFLSLAAEKPWLLFGPAEEC